MSRACPLLNFPVLAAILKKDLLCLWPLVLLAALVFGADVLIVRLELLPLWTAFQLPFILLASTLLIVALFQLDGPVSLRDDWLCRPVPKRELLAAKLLLVLVVIYGTRALATLLADRLLGRSWVESLLDAVLLQDSYFQLVLPILLMAAVVTATLVQAIGLLIALFVLVFLLPTPLIQPPGPLDTAIGEALPGAGLEWMILVPTKLTALPLLALCFWLVYWRRKITLARVVLLATVGLTVFFFVLPMWLLPWQSVFALQRATLAEADSVTVEQSESIHLHSVRQCFPAARIGDLNSDSAFNAARQFNGLALWSEESLRAAGPDSLTFLSSVAARGLPLDWRVKLNHVQALYTSADGATTVALRPANYLTDEGPSATLSHAWVLPQRELELLSAGGEPTLRLQYSLTLLAPTSFDLRTDGTRQHFPGLGYCSATLDGLRNRVEVSCFSPDYPGQISAELGGIPASRVYSGPEFSPAWASLPRGHHTELLVDSPRLSPHDYVTLTAWRPRAYLSKSWSGKGILGADRETCPLPAQDRNLTPLRSRWSDAADHETLYLSVDEGVHVEVLDFGGTGTPLLLLPGLGATAHSFDTLGPELAQRYRVFALTRRGAGGSSRPDSGYGTARLAQDVLTVMDALELPQAVLAGHSIAGDELSWLGGQHPERVLALIYLDAAYERGAAAAPDRRVRELNAQLPPEPPPRVQDLLNYPAFQTFQDRRDGVHIPEGELIAFHNVNNPYLAGMPNMDRRVAEAIVAAIQVPNYAAVRVPSLALYATSDGGVKLKPWQDPNDAELVAALRELAQLRDREQRASIDRFRADMQRGKVVEMPGAKHWIFLSHESEVLREIDVFLGDLGLLKK